MKEQTNEARISKLLEKLRQELNVKKEIFDTITIKLLQNTINDLQSLEKEGCAK